VGDASLGAGVAAEGGVVVGEGRGNAVGEPVVVAGVGSDATLMGVTVTHPASRTGIASATAVAGKRDVRICRPSYGAREIRR
jgi:hypothetical protein